MDSRPGYVSDEELYAAGRVLRGRRDRARRIVTATALPRGGGDAPTGHHRGDDTTFPPTGTPPFPAATAEPRRDSRRAGGGPRHGDGYLLRRRRPDPLCCSFGGPERGACSDADNPQSGGECGAAGGVDAARGADESELVRRCPFAATRRTLRTSWRRWATTIRRRHNASATMGTIFWRRPARRWVGQEAMAHLTKAVAPPLRPEGPAHPGEILATHAAAAAPEPVRRADRPRAPTRQPHRARTTAGRAIRTAAGVRAATRPVPPMTAARAARRRRARRCRPVAHKGAPRAVAHRCKARGTTTAREGPRLTRRAHPVVSRPPVEATRRPGNLQADRV